MVRFIRLFSFIFLCSYFFTAYADSADDQLIQLLNTIQTMQADFTQTVTGKKGKILNYSQGQMLLQRPGKFRWDVKQPNEQSIVTDGKKVWIYDKDLEQMTIRRLNKETGATPALLLSDTDATLTKDFNVRIENNGGVQWFLLSPKDKSSLFAVIKLGFVNQKIQLMQLQDHLGHVTAIRFNRIILNQQLSARSFNIRVPAEVDVIDETRK